jgi:hypothetical protein
VLLKIFTGAAKHTLSETRACVWHAIDDKEQFAKEEARVSAGKGVDGSWRPSRRCNE